MKSKNVKNPAEVGSYIQPHVRPIVLTKTADYTIQAADLATGTCVVLVDIVTAGAPVAITLPALSGLQDGQMVIIKRLPGVSADAVTATPDGSDTVDGAASFVLDDAGESVSLMVPTSGTNWSIV